MALTNFKSPDSFQLLRKKKSKFLSMPNKEGNYLSYLPNWNMLDSLKEAAMFWMFCPPPHPHSPLVICRNPNAQGDGIRKWGFGRVLLSWGALMDGIRVFRKGAQENFLTLPPQEDTWGRLWLGSVPSSDHAATLISDCQFPELWEINFCCL